MEGRTRMNGRPTRAAHCLLVFHGDARERLIEELERMAKYRLTLFQRLRPSNQSKCPYLVDSVWDGSVVVAWRNPYLVATVRERLAVLRHLLDRS